MSEKKEGERKEGCNNNSIIDTRPEKRALFNYIDLSA